MFCTTFIGLLTSFHYCLQHVKSHCLNTIFQDVYQLPTQCSKYDHQAKSLGTQSPRIRDSVADGKNIGTMLQDAHPQLGSAGPAHLKRLACHKNVLQQKIKANTINKLRIVGCKCWFRLGFRPRPTPPRLKPTTRRVRRILAAGHPWVKTFQATRQLNCRMFAHFVVEPSRWAAPLVEGSN